MDTYLNRYVNLRPTTLQEYERIVAHDIKPALGNVLISKLTGLMLDDYYEQKGKYLSDTTVNHHHNLIHGALKIARKKHLITFNPADDATPPQPDTKTPATWTPEQAKKFLEYSKEYNYYPLFFTELQTGVRRSELLALRWKDIDFIYCQISIVRALHHLNNGKFVYTEPKTDKSKRSIPVSPAVLNVLRQHKEAQASMLKSGPDSERETLKIDENSLVFADSARKSSCN